MINESHLVSDLLALRFLTFLPFHLIGVSVTGLEPEFQPVVNDLLPSIIYHKQDAHDLHLQVDPIVLSIMFIVYPVFVFLYLSAF